MKKLIASTAFVALLALGMPGIAHAQSTDTQSTHDLNKAEIDRINGNPSTPGDEQPGADGEHHGEWKHEHGGHCMHHHHHCGHHHGHHHHHHHHHHWHHDQNHEHAQAPAASDAAPEQPAAQ